MKQITFLLVVLIIFISCNDKNIEKVAQENANLTNQLIEKQSQIETKTKQLVRLEDRLAILENKEGKTAENNTEIVGHNFFYFVVLM